MQKNLAMNARELLLCCVRGEESNPPRRGNPKNQNNGWHIRAYPTWPTSRDPLRRNASAIWCTLFPPQSSLRMLTSQLATPYAWYLPLFLQPPWHLVPLEKFSRCRDFLFPRPRPNSPSHHPKGLHRPDIPARRIDFLTFSQGAHSHHLA